MARRPTYEELEQRVKELEGQSLVPMRVEQTSDDSGQKQRESEDLFYKAFFMSPISTTITTISDGYVLKVNEAFERLTGYRENEIKNQSLAKLNIWVDPEDRSRVVKDLLEKGPVRNREVKIRKKSEEIRVCLYSAELIEFGGKPHILSMAIDDTERKRAEEALRESETRYREIASSIPGVVYQFLLKKDGSYSSPYISESASRILDISAEEIMANAYSLFNMIVEEDLDSVNRSIAESAQTMEIWLQEFRIRDRAGNIRWIRATSTPHLLPDGEILWNGVLLDISDRVQAEEALQRAHNDLERKIEERTAELAKANEELLAEIMERKQTEEALRESEEKYRTILESIEDGYYEIDIAGNFTFINNSLCKIGGYSKNELMGTNYRLYTDPEDVKRVYQAFNKVYTTGKPIKRFEWKIIRKDGAERHIEVSISLMKDPEGHRSGFQGIIRDVTERKQMEAELIKTKNFLQNIFDSSIDGITITDLQGNIQYTTPNVKNILGYEQEEVTGKRVYLSYENGVEDAKRIMKELTNKGEVRNHEMRLIHKDGGLIDINLSASLLKNETGEIIGTLGIYRNITDKKKLEAQLQQAQKMEAIGTLAGGIAHNFNNLLMIIMGNTSLMLLNTNPDDPNYEKLKVMEKAAKSGATLTSQLLGYARKGRYEVTPISLNQLVEETSSTFSMARKEIRVHREFTAELSGIIADQEKIEQVLLNLYVNAADAMLGGGDLFLKTMNVTDKDMKDKSYSPKQGNYVLLTVRDTGVGMDKETMARIFEPFFTTKGLAEGTGLGLASTYGIIKAHGGYIDVDSEKWHGTTFSIYLPATKGEVNEERGYSGDLVKGKETVLLVDDEEMVLDTGEQMLRNLGYEVLLALSGHEALELYKKNQDKIDMVLLDMVMPGMDGGETFDRIKEIHPKVKVLLSSGYNIDGQATEILKRGCDGFIQKPFNMNQLSLSIRRILDKK